MSTKIVESLALIHIYITKKIRFRFEKEAYLRSTSNEYIQVIFYGEIS